MSSSNAPNEGSPKWNSPNARASRDRQFRKLSVAKATLLSACSRNSHAFSDARSEISSSAVPRQQTTRNSSAAQKRLPQNSSMPMRSSTQSTRQTRFDTVVPGGQKPWHVKLYRDVGKLVAKIGLEDRRFCPTLRELVDALKANPKQFPKKKGKLKDARAAELSFKGVTFRAVFTLNEGTREVLYWPSIRTIRHTIRQSGEFEAIGRARRRENIHAMRAYALAAAIGLLPLIAGCQPAVVGPCFLSASGSVEHASAQLRNRSSKRIDFVGVIFTLPKNGMGMEFPFRISIVPGQTVTAYATSPISSDGPVTRPENGKTACSVRRVQYADGTQWWAPSRL